MTYEFFDQDGNVYELDFPMSEAPPLGARIRHEGKILTRKASRFHWGWESSNAPRNDEDRALAVHMFNEPNPLNPGGVSDAQLVKQGDAVTRDMKHSSFTTGTL